MVGEVGAEVDSEEEEGVVDEDFKTCSERWTAPDNTKHCYPVNLNEISHPRFVGSKLQHDVRLTIKAIVMRKTLDLEHLPRGSTKSIYSDGRYLQCFSVMLYLMPCCG